jgi:hypothetical protein
MRDGHFLRWWVCKWYAVCDTIFYSLFFLVGITIIIAGCQMKVLFLRDSILLIVRYFDVNLFKKLSLINDTVSGFSGLPL